MSDVTVTRGRRDCRCPRVKHTHGTSAAYQSDGCRCLECRAAMARVRTAYMRFYRGRGEKPASVQLVDGTGTVRRLQALATLGWDAPSLAPHVGVSAERVWQLRSGKHPTLQARTADAVARAYEHLSMTRRPDGREARMCRAYAQRQRWVPPLAWDDDTIDDPDAEPRTIADTDVEVDEVAVEEAIAGRRVTLTRAERREVVHRLTARGYSAAEIAERLGTYGRMVNRDRAKVRAA